MHWGEVRVPGWRAADADGELKDVAVGDVQVGAGEHHRLLGDT